ncbi:hypothetical protein KP509_1Z256200 [Ceratopteris richardii]|nr:hypothetical protein KP509_1Z256200 [Ceratopteris richardii]
MQPILLATEAAHRRSLKRNAEGRAADVAPNAKQPPPPEEARAPSTVQQEASSFKQVLPVRITLKRGLSVRLTLKTRGCPIQEEQGNNHTAAPPPSRADQTAYTEDVEAGMRAHELKCRRLWDALALRLKAEMTRRRRHAEKQPEEADAADTKKLGQFAA